MSWLPDDAIERLRDAAESPELPGDRYELLDRLDRGGMGVVWRARDRALDREVAVKVLDSPGPDAAGRARLLREARILARLEHPGIVPVHDVGTLADGRAWYAMKRVDGTRLDAIARGPASLAHRLRLFDRVCEAVASAHARGVIHRDLKPENVMVGAFGEVLVMDWGVARLVQEPVPETRLVVGTPGWMPPEQEAGLSHEADPRADVFTLGSMLGYLAGSADGRMPSPLRSITSRATRSVPDERYQSVIDLAEDVRRFLDGEVPRAHRESAGERVVRLAARHRTAILLLLAYVVMRTLMLAFART